MSQHDAGSRPSPETTSDTEEQTPALPMTKEDIRRERAVSIFLRYYGERMPLADCWFQVMSHSKASRSSAASMAWVELRWLIQNYPLDFDNRLYAHNLGIDRGLAKLNFLLDATTPVKAGEELKRREDGQVVRKETIFEHFPELRTQYAAYVQLMALHGHGSGATRRPLAAEGKSLEDAKVNEPLPKTVEEARERGVPITLIEHPPEISREQWKKEYDAYQAEKERKRREEGPLW